MSQHCTQHTLELHTISGPLAAAQSTSPMCRCLQEQKTPNVHARLQTVRVTVHSEGPTHIIRFDDHEASICDGDVLQNLAQLRQEAWRIDAILRRYQDEKGILIDILLAAHDSQALTGRNSVQFSMSEDEFRPYAQSVHGGSTCSANLAVAASRHLSLDADRRISRRLDSMHFPSVTEQGSHVLMTHQAVAEATEGIAGCSSFGSGTASDRRCSQVTAWTFERDSSIAASTAGLQYAISDAHKDAAGETAAAADPGDPRSSSEDELVNWVQSLPAQTQRSTNSLQSTSHRRSESKVIQAARGNFKEGMPTRRVVFWQGSQKFGSNKQQRSSAGRQSTDVQPRLQRSSQSLDNRFQACSSPGVRSYRT